MLPPVTDKTAKSLFDNDCEAVIMARPNTAGEQPCGSSEPHAGLLPRRLSLAGAVMAHTLHRLIKRFLTWAKKALSPATVSAYRHHLRRFMLHVADIRVSSLKPIHLTSWATTWHEYQAVSRLFSWFVKDAKLGKINPFAGVKKPQRRMRRRVLTPQQMTMLLRRAGPEGRAFLLAMRETLARPQEIRNAKWHELSLDDPTADVAKAIPAGQVAFVQWAFKDAERRADGSRARLLLVTPRLGRLLERLARRRPPGCDHVFLNSEGKPWTRNAVRCMMRRLRVKCNLPADANGEKVCAYTFRHSQATLAVSRGVVDRTLADLLGHVETRTTSRYLHLQRSHLRDAMKRIERKPRKKTS